jgi:adenosylmethionine-8-amino-7-oxononanoate aminotransferase
MACVECVLDKDSKEPLKLDKAIGRRIDEHAERLGLIVRPLYSMCVLSPPLVITRSQVDELVEILRKSILLAMDDVRREGLWRG